MKMSEKETKIEFGIFFYFFFNCHISLDSPANQQEIRK